MPKFENSNALRVFHYFEQLSKIPRGSGNMKAVSEFCGNFAKEHKLEYITDDAQNIVIFKNGGAGYENSEPIILQGHLDMVCQKNEGCDKNFETDGIDFYVDGDYIKANGTTLGADNGIAVALILAILEDNNLAHPPIEAVFTTDEEVGMIGALKLDMSVLKAKKMINLDSEDEGVITVSCAGGEDFTAKLPVKTEIKNGTEITVIVKGLKGGHSGVEINSGRVNADLLAARILAEVKSDFDIMGINGGDKPNAIPNRCECKICTTDAEAFCAEIDKYIKTVKKEISAREENFTVEITIGNSGTYTVYDKNTKEKLLFALVCIPNGVIEMSAEIDGLVETSLNLGILKEENNEIVICSSLRSNKKSAQEFLKRRLMLFYDKLECEYEASGYYPPWEFKENSALQRLYKRVYSDYCNTVPKSEAIHAGLECGVFSAAKEDRECISVGPQMHGVHTTEEKLSISSTERLFEIIKIVLEKLK